MPSLKDRLGAWNDQQIRAAVAREIAVAIEKSAPGEPDGHCAGVSCTVCVMLIQARSDAAIARRIGGVT